ncbi:MAG: tRNA pseudouridine(38-40) synthase TruA [Erythrobacter sp.]
MPRYKLTVEYDGRPFMGWQRQAHGLSVQQALEDALHRITGGEILVQGCGRTDSGVHALAQVAHVDLEKSFDPFRLQEAINAVARPHPVAVVAVEKVPDDFHARFDCRARHYRYVIRNRRAPLTLTEGREWRIPAYLNENAMRAAAQHLEGKHDFTTFRAAHCQAKSPIRTLTSLTVRRVDDRIIVEASAPSFLHHQIRSITGCLAMVGDGRWTDADMKAALDARDRTALGFNAPPDGLYFVSADYDD